VRLSRLASLEASFAIAIGIVIEIFLVVRAGI